MKLNQAFLKKCFQLTAFFLPHGNLLFPCLQKKLQSFELFRQLSGFRYKNSKTGKEVSEIQGQRLSHIRSFPALRLRKMDLRCSVSQKPEIIFPVSGRGTPSGQAQYMSMAVVIFFFIHTEAKFIHIFSSYHS